MFHEHGHSHGGGSGHDHSHGHSNQGESAAEEGHSHAISAKKLGDNGKPNGQFARKHGHQHNHHDESAHETGEEDERSPLLASKMNGKSGGIPFGGSETPLTDEGDDTLDELLVHPARTREAIVRQAYDAGFGSSPRTVGDSQGMGHRRSLSVPSQNKKPKKETLGQQDASAVSASKQYALEENRRSTDAHRHSHDHIEGDGHSHEHGHGSDEHDEIEEGHHDEGENEHDHDHDHDESHSGGGHGHSHGNMNMRGVFLHVMGDAVRRFIFPLETWHRMRLT